MTEQTTPSNFIKEDEKTAPKPISSAVLLQKLLLSQQNLLDACNDIARCLTLLTRDNHSLPDVIQKIGAVKASIAITTDRLTDVSERLQNP